MKLKVVKLADSLVAQTADCQIISKMAAVPTLPTRKKYIITDDTDQPLGDIKRLRNNFGLYDLPRYALSLHKHEAVTVIKNMAQFHSKYVITGAGLAIQGELLSDAFSVTINEKEYASVTVEKAQDDFAFHLNISDTSQNDLLIGFIYLLALAYEDEHYLVRVQQTNTNLAASNSIQKTD